MPQIETAFLMVKPDGVARRLIGHVVARVEATTLQLAAAKLLQPTESQATQHFLRKRDGSSGLTLEQAVEYLTSGPVFAMAWCGVSAIGTLRSLVGSQTDPYACATGTIRRDFAADSLLSANGEYRAVRNVVHSSNDVYAAEVEIQIWLR